MKVVAPTIYQLEVSKLWGHSDLVRRGRPLLRGRVVAARQLLPGFGGNPCAARI